jgi:chorismate mutase
VTLAKIRKNIDAIDAEILSLLHRRFQFALGTRPFKSLPRDPSREREILDNLRAKSAEYPLLRENFVLDLYGEILRESRRLQRRSGRNKNQEKQT